MTQEDAYYTIEEQNDRDRKVMTYIFQGLKDYQLAESVSRLMQETGWTAAEALEEQIDIHVPDSIYHS